MRPYNKAGSSSSRGHRGIGSGLPPAPREAFSSHWNQEAQGTGGEESAGRHHGASSSHENMAPGEEEEEEGNQPPPQFTGMMLGGGGVGYPPQQQVGGIDWVSAQLQQQRPRGSSSGSISEGGDQWDQEKETEDFSLWSPWMEPTTAAATSSSSSQRPCQACEHASGKYNVFMDRKVDVSV